MLLHQKIYKSETWNFYFRTNQVTLNKLIDFCDEFGDFSIKDKKYSKEEIDMLLNLDDDNTYMAKHNFVGNIVLPTALPNKKVLTYYDIESILYKGGIMDLRIGE